MALGDRRYRYAGHTAWGALGNFLQNVIEHTFAYTYHKKKISAATVGAVLASTSGSSSNQVITSGITALDVPRVLAVTIGGSGFSNDKITVSGFNIEGKAITDTFSYTGTGQVTGALVFKSISSVTLPGTLGASATVSVDTTNRIGLNHRLIPNFSTIVVIQDATPGTVGQLSTKPTVQAAASGSNFDNQFVEKNWVLPATAPDGTTYHYYFYWFHKVLVYPPKDSPEFYSTTTSTSTSSTSTSTSTSSTSTSISTSSTSTSSTSTSFSSTSTSTTTLPV